MKCTVVRFPKNWFPAKLVKDEVVAFEFSEIGEWRFRGAHCAMQLLKQAVNSDVEKSISPCFYRLGFDVQIKVRNWGRIQKSDTRFGCHKT